MFLDEAAGRTLKESVNESFWASRRLQVGPAGTKRKLLAAGRKRMLLTKADSLAMLLPVATWKIKDVPNEGKVQIRRCTG